MATYDPGSESLIRLVDRLCEAANDADREMTEAFSVLYGMDEVNRWDGYIIGSDSPLNIVGVNIDYLRDELNRLALDLRTGGISA